MVQTFKLMERWNNFLQGVRSGSYLSCSLHVVGAIAYCSVLQVQLRVPCLGSCIAVSAHCCCCCGLQLTSVLRGATWKRQVDGENQGENEDLDRHGKCFRGSCLFVIAFVYVSQAVHSEQLLMRYVSLFLNYMELLKKGSQTLMFFLFFILNVRMFTDVIIPVIDDRRLPTLKQNYIWD